ncbi:MAG: creatininase family protein, partial [Chloroflexi bacterium]|nr:creatininase family protein [Chloroflexota bacterium]
MTVLLYTELRPSEFRERLAAAPIAYLPLGTLEWHGEHLPLGSDGLQAQGFFLELAREVGGIVLPMLFLGPDRACAGPDGRPLYGMDCADWGTHPYAPQQLAGSAYWLPDEAFKTLLELTLAQLARAGFRIVVAHGHGPSTQHFQARNAEWRARFGLDCYTCWGSAVDAEGLGIQVDHAAMNETSLMLALRPDLVEMAALPARPEEWPLAVEGKDPRRHASADLG